MRRAVRLSLLGAGVYLGALALQVPAAWLAHWGRPALPEAVSLGQVEGSLWHPRVERFAVDLPGSRRLEGGPADARIRPLPLFLGRLQAQLEASALGGKASGGLWMGLDGGWQVPRFRADLPLERLGEVDPRLDFGQGGTLDLAGEGLKGARLPEEGTLHATVREFRLPGLGPEGVYGTYEAEGQFSGPGKIQGRVTTTRSRVLAVKGRFQADLQGGTARFNGEAWAPEGAPEAARQLLSLFGQVQNGRVRIRWQGRLR